MTHETSENCYPENENEDRWRALECFYLKRPRHRRLLLTPKLVL